MTQHNKTSYVDRRNIFKVIEHLSQTVGLTYDEIHHEVDLALSILQGHVANIEQDELEQIRLSSKYKTHRIDKNKSKPVSVKEYKRLLKAISRN